MFRLLCWRQTWVIWDGPEQDCSGDPLPPSSVMLPSCLHSRGTRLFPKQKLHRVEGSLGGSPRGFPPCI